MTLHRLGGLSAALLVAATLPACSSNTAPVKGGSGPSKPKVAFVSNNSHQFWTIAEAGTKKAADEFNAEVHFKRPQTGTAAEQKTIIDTLVAQQVQAIAISVNDPKNQTQFLNRIADQGIHLITQDNDAPESKRLCYIGTDNYEAGKAVGKLVKEAMPSGGHIAIFVGKPDPLNAKERRQGVLDELAGTKDAKGPKQFGNYTLLDTFYDDTDPKAAKDKAANALVQLQNEPNVCLIGLWAYNPPAILSAVKDAGKQGKVHIVGMDEDDNTLLGVKDGHIHGTIVQQPFEFGYQSVKLMTQLVKGDKSAVPGNGILHVPHLVIKKDNVEEFHKRLNSMLGK
jgi:ribose transport system substrate-binding protein